MAKKVSRQRLWQIKMRKLGRCCGCGKTAVGHLCSACQEKVRRRVMGNRLRQRFPRCSVCDSIGHNSRSHRT